MVQDRATVTMADWYVCCVQKKSFLNQAFSSTHSHTLSQQFTEMFIWNGKAYLYNGTLTGAFFTFLQAKNI